MTDSESLCIRDAEPDDFLAVAELDRRAWRQYPNGDAIPDGEHTWRVWCELGVTVVALLGDRLVGAAMAFACRDGRYCVHKVMVDSDCRGRGVGRAVLERLLALLDADNHTAFLTVNPDNVKAVQLYQDLGFGDAEFVAGYYRPDEHRLVMTRPPGGVR